MLAPNVSLTGSVPVIDVTGPEPVEHRGYVPPYSVVVPGTRPKEFPAGTFQLGCALIIGWRSAQTDLKTSLNDVLREYEIGVLATATGSAGPVSVARPVVQAHAQVAAREVHEHVALAVRRRGDRDRARAGRARLPHAALPDARRHLARPVDARDLDVRAVREARVRLEQRAEPRQVVGIADDDRVRVADDDRRELDAGDASRAGRPATSPMSDS